MWHRVGKSAVLIVSDAKIEEEELQPEKQDKQSRKERKADASGKLKYVPGPIGALIDQAEVVGLHLALNSGNGLEFQREGRGPIPLAGWNRKAWNKEVKKHINGDLLRELHEAVAPAHDAEGKEIPPRRNSTEECG